jgi:hypothetical protein
MLRLAELRNYFNKEDEDRRLIHFWPPPDHAVVRPYLHDHWLGGGPTDFVDT